MAFAPVFQRPFSATFDRRAAVAAWYRAGGAPLPVAAYQPKGAASLAASYVNLALPGTYDAAPGVAPSFDAATGWTFNRSLGQYLSISNTGYLLKPTTVLIRMTRSGTSFRGVLGGSSNVCFAILVWNNNREKIQSQYITDIYDGENAFPEADTVLGFSYSAVGAYAHYRNGMLVSSGTKNVIITTKTDRIGYSPDGTFTGSMAAISIYNTTLTAPQVAAVSAAMAAL